MVTQGKEWRIKTNSQLEPFKLVRPVAGVGQTGGPEMSPSFSSSDPMVCDDKFTLAPTP
jgi:hypothetical protein